MLTPEYPQKTLLPEITHHEALPVGAIELARISDRLNYKRLFIFLKVETLLVIVKAGGTAINADKRYSISQFEAPLGMLPWFAEALNEFRKSPAEGGLHAGAMNSHDANVEGDVLCIQRAMDAGNGQSGYDILNRSRPSRSYLERGSYRASRIAFADNLIYEGGLLTLFEDLGEKYKKGQL